jgi:hypothetical protein
VPGFGAGAKDRLGQVRARLPSIRSGVC